MMVLMVPIFLSAVLVFIASALIWMVMPHHKTDFKTLPNEDAVRAALNAGKAGAGQYMIPAGGMESANDPARIKKLQEGPVGLLTLRQAPVTMAMGPMLVQSFVYYVAVSFVVAYLTSRTIPHGTEYLQVFRAVGTISWLAYGFGVIPESIWFGRPWSNTVKTLADALVFALLTAGTFAWRWPG